MADIRFMANRVLAAEDSRTQGMALQAHLEGAGFEVTLATDGGSALALFEREPFDLVVSDIVMPGMDGYELCRQVKERDPDLPVVLLTSMTDPLDVINALSAGADNFLRKPYKPEELVHRVRSMLFNRELRDSGRTQMGLEVFFLGRKFMINADREQILDLLMSTFEDLVSTNVDLREREAELNAAHERLVTELAATELQRDRLNAVLGALPEAMVVVDAEGTIIEHNAVLKRLLGLPDTELAGAHFTEIVKFIDHRGHVLDTAERGLMRAVCEGEDVVLGSAFDLHAERNDGSRFPAIASAAPIRGRSGTVVGAVGVLKDIAALVEHDPLTGLPGHGILIERMRAAADNADKAGLLVLSIDRYERIRSRMPAAGHSRVLSTVIERLERTLDSERVRMSTASASAAYLGGGEIAVVLPDLATEAEAIVVGEILAEELRGDVRVDDVDVVVSVSIGVGIIGDTPDPWNLVAGVAAAARQAAAGGRSVLAHDSSLHAAVVEGMRREQELRRALKEGQLVVHYQPLLQLRGDAPVAAEALVRWQHPERGLLGAGDIIPLAEDCNLIADVSWWVLEEACHQARSWRRDLPHGDQFSLSVNLAPEQLAEDRVVEKIREILDRTGLEPTCLILEITEGSVTSDPDAARQRLAAIKAMGVQIAVDDFGTGYSSLLQLRRLPIDILKIDRSFVSTMIEEPADAAIVAGSVRLARALGLEVVAEGVETMDQVVQLRVLGCDKGQGYHWSRPLPAEEFVPWWTAKVRPASSHGTGPALDEGGDTSGEDAMAYLIHELRSPLAVVIGFAELLGEVDPTSAPHRYLDAILRNAREVEARLSHVADARDALHGGIALNLELVDVAGLARDVVADIADQLAPHEVSVIAEGTVSAWADGGRLTQALMNLLTNAGKFSPPSAPILVTVTAGDGGAAITVRDHGAGIPPHRRNELFRRFSRLGSRAKGMGVGLYLSRLIVDAHGGELVYEPAPGGGSLFQILLPPAEVPVPPRRERAAVGEVRSS